MVLSRHLLFSRKLGGGGVAVPQGAIAMWSGLLANIPANWDLCDGTGGTPNLIARFLRGAPAATEAGTTGGSDTHTHASMTAAGTHTHTAQNQSHSHVVNSAGAHKHGGAYRSITGGLRVMSNTVGGHTHTTDSKAHGHTMDTDANHTHTISTDDGRPPFYELAFIQAGAGALVDANIIIIWTGTLAAIPAGWSLCDGSGGKPDLRQRFIRGVNTAVTNPGNIGGAATHNHTEGDYVHSHVMDDSGIHSHSFSAFTWTHDHDTLYALTVAGGSLEQTDTGGGNHTHANSDSIGSHNHNAMGNSTHTHVVNAASSLPAYYDVAFIINDGGAAIIPVGGILIWTGLLANIPPPYNQCDGAGGRPNLLARFLRGSAPGVDPGGTGGSDTHTHTDQNGGAHADHSMVNTGAHQHAATDTLGAHTHATSGSAMGDGAITYGNNSAGDHSHTYNSENDHTHTLTDPGNHNHNPWSTDDGRPAFYEVIYIIKG